MSDDATRIASAVACRLLGGHKLAKYSGPWWYTANPTCDDDALENTCHWHSGPACEHCGLYVCSFCEETYDGANGLRRSSPVLEDDAEHDDPYYIDGATAEWRESVRPRHD